MILVCPFQPILLCDSVLHARLKEKINPVCLSIDNCPKILAPSILWTSGTEAYSSKPFKKCWNGISSKAMCQLLGTGLDVHLSNYLGLQWKPRIWSCLLTDSRIELGRASRQVLQRKEISQIKFKCLLLLSATRLQWMLWQVGFKAVWGQKVNVSEVLEM